MTPQERLVVLIDIITTKAIEFQNFADHCHHLPGTDHWPPSVRFAVIRADKDRRLVGMIEQGRIRQVISREIFRKEDITIFDQLYNEFWFGKDRANRMLPASQLNRAISS
jgi:hypothetical protein